MTVQTSYTKIMRQAIAGMLAHDFGPADTASFTVTLRDIPFGVFVQRGAEGNTGAPTAGGELYRRQTIVDGADSAITDTTVVGVTLRQLMQPNALHQIPGQAHSAPSETQSVLRSGYVYVDLQPNDASEAAVAGDGVFIDAATGEILPNANAATGRTLIPISGAQFEVGAIAGETALIRIDIVRPIVAVAP